MSDATTFADEDGDENTLDAEFATVTMGHVLLGQGRPDAARAVFRAVLAKDPSNADALQALESLVDPLPATASGLAVARVDATSLRVRWSVGGEAVLPTMELVIVSLWVEAGALQRSERSLLLSSSQGERLVVALPPGATHHLAAGVRRSGTFVPRWFATAPASPAGT